MASKRENRMLVENDICRVKYCVDCGHVHISLGAMTLHLSGQQFELLAKSLEQAATGKREIDDPRSRQRFRAVEVVH